MARGRSDQARPGSWRSTPKFVAPYPTGPSPCLGGLGGSPRGVFTPGVGSPSRGHVGYGAAKIVELVEIRVCAGSDLRKATIAEPGCERVLRPVSELAVRQANPPAFNLETAVDRFEQYTTNCYSGNYVPARHSPIGSGPLRPPEHAPRGSWLRYNSLE